MEKMLVVASLVAFASCSLLLWILKSVALHIGLIDHPGGHKSHGNPTPVVGGIAMFTAFAFAALVFDVSLLAYRMLFAGALVLMVVGVLDDLHELSTWQRFAAQVIAALLMTIGAGVVLHDLGHLLLPDALFSLGILAIPCTLFATVGMINALNMVDGLDGLAASLVLVAIASLCVIAWTSDEPQVLAILSLLAAVVLAFFMFNLRLNGGALVFMGDAGSMLLGFTIAWFLIQFSQGEDRMMEPVTALWLFALPLIDTVSMVARRMLRERSPFLADREHFHHILIAAGFTQKQSLGVMVLLSVAAAGVGLAGHFLGVAEPLMFFAFLGLFALHFWTIMRAWRVKRFLGRPLLHFAETSA